MSASTANAVIAIGTVASVAVAAVTAIVFGLFIPLRRRPKLCVSAPERNANSPWFRATVENRGRYDSAEDVQAIVRSVKSGPSRSDLRDRDLGGWALMWTAIDDPPFALIPPGVHRYLNIGFISGDSHRARSCFCLDVHRPPQEFDPRNRWTDRFAEIEVAIGARRTKAETRCFLVDLHGEELDAEVTMIPCEQIQRRILVHAPASQGRD